VSEEPEPDPRRWKALAVCLVAGFMTLLDVSIVNTALPSIEDGLGAEPNELQWIVSGYALTLGLLLVPSGRVGDARAVPR
jgi:MFS family permease